MHSDNRKPFSRARRHFLKAGVSGAVAAASSGTLLSLSSLQDVQAAQTMNCIRSPWAYFPFAPEPLTKGLDYGNEALPGLVPLTDDPFQWSSVGAWSGNGINTGLELPWSADPIGLNEVMLPKRGAYLVGALINHPSPLNNSETVFRAGQQITGVTGQELLEVELKVNVNGRAAIQLRDDNGQLRNIAILERVQDTNNALVVLMAYVDHRVGGPETATLYQYIPGTTQRTSRTASIAGLGNISGGPDSADKMINIGMRRNGYGQTLKHFTGTITRVNVINFGDRPPANIDPILDGFALNSMAPGAFLEGV